MREQKLGFVAVGFPGGARLVRKNNPACEKKKTRMVCMHLLIASMFVR